MPGVRGFVMSMALMGSLLARTHLLLSWFISEISDAWLSYCATHRCIAALG